MFEFNLENGSHTSVYYSETGDIKFDPPVYEQRYCMAVRVLEHKLFKGHIRKVVDFGCAEIRLLELLKRTDGVEHVLEVDIDENLLMTYSMRAKPLISDYLNPRITPLRVDIYKGSIDSSVDCLLATDAVIAIEIIEHLYPDVLENVPYNIFGYIRPKLAIFSTPNSEYNILFNLTLPTGFRHDDHKFEWTRQEFQDWCYNVCSRFPNYQVAFLGAGEPPPTHQDIGHVTQIAVFIRNDIRDLSLVEDILGHCEKLPTTEEYKLLCSVEFPLSKDQRTYDEKLLDDVKYHINRHINMKTRFFNNESDTYEIPLTNIFEFVFPSVMTIDELKDFVVSRQYKVDNENRVIVSRSSSEDESYSDRSEPEHEIDAECRETIPEDKHLHECWD